MDVTFLLFPAFHLNSGKDIAIICAVQASGARRDIEDFDRRI